MSVSWGKDDYWRKKAEEERVRIEDKLRKRQWYTMGFFLGLIGFFLLVYTVKNPIDFSFLGKLAQISGISHKVSDSTAEPIAEPNLAKN